MSKKYYLGIQSYANHDTGASIVSFDTKTKKIDYVCISEERLIRKKYPYSFPIHSINYCMEYFNLKSLNKINYIITDWIKVKRWHRSGPSYNYSMFDYFKEKFNFPQNKIIQIDHHLAHAASVYYTSKFKESAILIVDGLGSDLETTTFYKGENNKIKELKKYKDHGIGTAYGAVTNHILNLGTGGEGKTMGLAPYGKKYKNQIKIKVKLDGIKNDFGDFMKRNPLSDTLNQINPNLRPNPIKISHKFCKDKNYLNKYFSGVAFDIQNTAEKVMSHLGKEIYKNTKSKNICIAGGVALNSVANKKLLDNSKFKNIFVFPACSDAGIPFGAALWGLFNLEKNAKRNEVKFDNAYTGKNYKNETILKILKKFNINYSKVDERLVAKYISQGKIIGRCAGRSEYGPRALGNRSILADARRSKMRNYLNKHVKHREMFRPFAPVILEEKNKEYFDLNQPSPYMLLVAKSHKAKLIPSAIHVDKTARVQTINREQNLSLYNIIKNFYKLTKVPVILNTSFNDAGEPIVESPLDSLICFLQTKIDYLILNDFIIEKKNFKKYKIKQIFNYRKKQIQKKEKEIIKNLMKPISKKEFNEKKKKYTKEAIYFAIENSKNKLKDFFIKFNRKKILLVGSNDHTYIICKMFQKYMKDMNLSFYNFQNKNDFLQNKYNPSIRSVSNLKNITSYDKIIISSFEYQRNIFDLISKKTKKNKIFQIYDNSSRSLMDSFIIKDIHTTKKYKNLVQEII